MSSPPPTTTSPSPPSSRPSSACEGALPQLSIFSSSTAASKVAPITGDSQTARRRVHIPSSFYGPSNPIQDSSSSSTSFLSNTDEAEHTFLARLLPQPVRNPPLAPSDAVPLAPPALSLPPHTADRKPSQA